jgi:glycosyltransferase involved in cell wall biosynthesis
LSTSKRQQVAYVTWGETVRFYGIYRSQVLETVARLAKDDPDRDYHIIAAMPVVHSGWVRERHRYFAQLKEARRLLGRAQLHIVPIMALQTAIFPTRKTFSAIYRGAGLTLNRMLKRYDFDLVHCRSLQSSYGMLKARADLGLTYKVVYDVRTLWPEEMRRRGSSVEDYVFFKSIEKQVAEQADAVVTVEENMEDLIRKVGARKTLANYLASEISNHSLAADKIRNSANDSLHMTYVGAIELDGIHDPRLLFSLFGWIKSDFKSARMTIISTSAHEPLKKLVKSEFSGLEESIDYTSFTDRKALLADLSNYDAGLNVHGESKNSNDAITAKTGFSTKSVEYLGAGLPIICTKNAMGIARIIEQNNIGLTFDPKNNGADISRDDLLALKTPAARKRAIEFAKKTFSYESSTGRLHQLYNELLAAD